MAANTTISNVAAIAAANAITALIDGGAGPGKLRIYDGAQPAGPDTAVSTQTLLAELTLSDPSFGTAVDGNPGGLATANAVTDDTSANATGIASWFRVVDSNGVAVIDGSAGVAADTPDLTLDNKNIQVGATVKVTSWTITMPEA